MGAGTVNFDLTEDEEMLKALTERFVSDHYSHDTRRAFLADANGFSPRNWELLGELGLIAAPFPEDAGGLGLDGTGISTVFEALGRGLVVEPLVENVVLAGRLFLKSAPEALRGAWLDGLVSGTRRLALAHAEEGSRGVPLWLETRAETRGDTIVLTGSKPFCAAGGGADGFIVSARSNGAPNAVDGIELYLVPADAKGLSIRRWTLADGSIAVSLTLDGVTVPASHRLHGGLATLEDAENVAALARCAEAVGIMSRLFDETLDYLRTREQFGMKLGKFQALQHRMVAQYAALEQCRALLIQAQVSWGTERFARNVQGARAFIAKASLDLGHEAIQFHGGMGVTDELSIGGAHKRLLVLSRWPESGEAALDRFAGLIN